jgi:hypothetical protein
MTQDLDRLLEELQGEPLDHSLGNVASDVNRRLAEASSAERQTWRLGALAAVAVTLSGVAVSGSLAASAAIPSPFDAWTRLAPSTLLETGK